MSEECPAIKEIAAGMFVDEFILATSTRFRSTRLRRRRRRCRRGFSGGTTTTTLLVNRDRPVPTASFIMIPVARFSALPGTDILTNGRVGLIQRTRAPAFQSILNTGEFVSFRVTGLNTGFDREFDNVHPF